MQRDAEGWQVEFAGPQGTRRVHTRLLVGADTEEDLRILRRIYSQFVNHVRIRYIEFKGNRSLSPVVLAASIATGFDSSTLVRCTRGHSAL